MAGQARAPAVRSGPRDPLLRSLARPFPGSARRYRAEHIAKDDRGHHPPRPVAGSEDAAVDMRDLRSGEVGQENPAVFLPDQADGRSVRSASVAAVAENPQAPLPCGSDRRAVDRILPGKVDALLHPAERGLLFRQERPNNGERRLRLPVHYQVENHDRPGAPFSDGRRIQQGLPPGRWRPDAALRALGTGKEISPAFTTT